MDRIGRYCAVLRNAWKYIMITLTIEEDQVLQDDILIPDLLLFLKRLPKNEDLVLILKCHDASYHYCPIRKAARFIKSAEYSAEHWVGEKVLPIAGLISKFFRKKTTIGGIKPTLFMRNAIRIIGEHTVAIRGIFIWADLILTAYSPLPKGWVIIWHDQNLIICRNNHLIISRFCYLPLSQEMPSILRYLRRYGYESGCSLTLITSSLFNDELPPYIQQEVRAPQDIEPNGLKLSIPECLPHARLYAWPSKLKAMCYSLAFCNTLWMAYLGWQIAFCYEQIPILKKHIAGITVTAPVNESKMEAFSQYCQITKERANPLLLLQQIVPYLKDKAVATFLHWTPHSLNLHLELNDIEKSDSLWNVLRLHFNEYHLIWRSHENEPLKGILSIKKKQMSTPNLQAS
jgi:hypothetical protein